MKFHALLLTLLAVWTASASAYTQEEHRQLAKAALDQVLGECGTTENGIDYLPLPGSERFAVPAAEDGKSFSALVADLAKDDGNRNRYHLRLQSIRDQLSVVGQEILGGLGAESFEENASDGNAAAGFVRVTEPGVMGRYLVHHWLALRFAARAGGHPADRESLFRQALTYEAKAQGYLADAFSASHILPPPWGPISWAHPINIHILHDSYRTTGLYVMNSRNDVWLTFGDGVLAWYPYCHQQVLDACATSLRELLTCFYQGAGYGSAPVALEEWLATQDTDWNTVAEWLDAHPGSDYYQTLRMPSLLRLPFLITAAWSKPSPAVISPPDAAVEVRGRDYYPQLSDPGFHDPGLDPETLHALPAAADVPAWLVLPELNEVDPETIVNERPEIASVLYRQILVRHPSYQGVTLVSGAGQMITSPLVGPALSLGAGWGFTDQMIPLRWLPNIQRGGLEVGWKTGIDDAEDFVEGKVTFQLYFPTRLDLHIEGGLAVGLDPPKGVGPVLGIGFTLDTFTIPGTYLAVLSRLKVATAFLDDRRGGVFLEFVIH